MSAEANEDGGLAWRAALHAAMADPGRLAIVDTLSWGEASPSELAARLGMTSNLLAHHLKVLAEVGLVTRHRSEGDRRRSYVALARDTLDTAAAPHTAGALQAAERVVFVCTHNSARSQLAAAMWNTASPVPATSAGTHPAPHVHPGAVAVARRRHLALAPTQPRHLRDVLDPADLIVTVCDSAHEEIATDQLAAEHAAEHGGRVGLHWSIPDPVRTGEPAAFDRVVDELTDRIDRLTPVVQTTCRVPTGTAGQDRSNP
jgi:ArsR family transcriptional regulator, arsenate/arsenite/antimonite-responsive transcriptional repressor / arsenate reductase (thioredoxin)